MLDIQNTLSGQDLGFLKIVANAWGIEIKAPDAYKARIQLALAMNDPEIIKEIYEALPEDVKIALDTLLEHDGRIPWAKFARDFGEIQVMGSAKRDRERPDLHPTTPTEYLWYRAFIGRAFFSTETEPKEFAFIPEEIFNELKPIQIQENQTPGRLASEKEIEKKYLVTDRILDDVCTVLAAMRNGFELEDINQFCEVPPTFLRNLLSGLNLISENGSVEPEKIRLLLESTRNDSLLAIEKTWVESDIINELFFLTDLVIDGNLDHNPKLARQFIIEQISLIPKEQWWNIDSFISYIYQTNPDFQRPAGNYDSWYIKDKKTNEYLRGFNHWKDIDGKYIFYLITQPLHWFGLVDLASSATDEKPSAFKQSEWFEDLVYNQKPENLKPEEEKITMDSYGKFNVPIRFKRAIRYQISRFCDWKTMHHENFVYQITPKSLERAKNQSLKVNHLIKIIQPAINHPFPPKLKSALENWEVHGTQAFYNNVLILQVADPEAIEKLQSSSVKKFIQGVLNPATVVINPAGMEQVKKALIELGYFVD
jgi:hypothetical protein